MVERFNGFVACFIVIHPPHSGTGTPKFLRGHYSPGPWVQNTMQAIQVG